MTEDGRAVAKDRAAAASMTTLHKPNARSGCNCFKAGARNETPENYNVFNPRSRTVRECKDERPVARPLRDAWCRLHPRKRRCFREGRVGTIIEKLETETCGREDPSKMTSSN